MAKTKPKQEEAPPVVRSFEIDGIVYTDGDKLQVIAPELGLIPVVVKFADYSNHHIMTMEFGWIRTPLPCRMNQRPDSPNASLSLSITRMPPAGSIQGYHSNVMHLVYFCNCAYSKHTDQFRWYTSFDMGVIRAEGLGWDYNKNRPHNHPLVEGYEHLQPMTYEVLKQELVQADKHGQFTLF
ncbi:hypothetical protein [Spirosoma sordidisoli]|uniref:Uncharacterized protein n=1 Tax=Spirosoma sordidisoli TaxID=2502893 RepID=A0A4Q2UMM4_9BACT|nr:hypothetical protein [Spirosoma sordidisoli]RYC70887.1 hypothetical protein EQG79_01670 [Spirosoma sordidisoli]